MQIQCDQCSAKYRIKIKRSSGSSIRFKCGKCDNIIVVPAEAEEPEAVRIPAKIPAKVPAKAAAKPAPGKARAVPAEAEDKKTLQVTCINCGTGFVKQARDKSRLCYQCRIDAIVSKKRAQQAAPEAGPKVEDESKSKYTIRNADGLVLGPIKLRTVAVLVREKRIQGNEEAKKDDGPFRPLSEIPELVQFFPRLKPKEVEPEEEEPEEAAAQEEEEEEIDIPIDEEELDAEVVKEKPPKKPKPPPPEPEPPVEEEEEEEEELAETVYGLDEVSVEVPASESALSGRDEEEQWAALDAKARKVEEILAREGIREEPEEPAFGEPEAAVDEEEEERLKESIEEKAKKREKIFARIKPRRLFEKKAEPEKKEEIKPAEEEEEIEELAEEVEEIEELVEEVEEMTVAPVDDESRYRVRYHDGMVLGPVKLSTVRDLFLAGNITGQEEVQREGDQWIPITGCKGLKDLFGSGDEIGEDEIVDLTEMMEEVD